MQQQNALKAMIYFPIYLLCSQSTESKSLEPDPEFLEDLERFLSSYAPGEGGDNQQDMVLRIFKRSGLRRYNRGRHDIGYCLNLVVLD